MYRLLLTSLFAAIALSGCAHTPKTHPQGAWPDRLLRGADVTTNATPEDLHHFASDWGGRVVRILHLSPMSDHAPYAVNEEVLSGMYKTASAALDQGLAVVFAPGVAMDNHDAFFGSAQFKHAFIEFWKRVATHFKDDRRVVAYDLLNEPHDELAKTQWSAYARELTQAIREIDPGHTIVVEAPEWSWPAGFEYLEPTGDENTIYSFHTYAPNEFTVQKTSKGFLTASDEQWEQRIYPGSILEGEVWNQSTMARKLAPVLEFRKKYGVRVWCGEFGTARWAKGALVWLQDMIDLFETNGIGWAYYSYREWPVMDLEMSPLVKNQKTPRADTDFVLMLKKAFAR